MSSSPFVHLHVHTDGSLLDGANPIDKLVARAKHFEMPALAVTDHGVMYSAWEFYETAKKQGINPIIGMEAYVAPGDRRDRKTKSLNGKAYYHLVLLARDLIGYKNLVKLTSIGFRDGFHYNPRIDREVLAQHSEGLIVSSACLAGEVAQALEVGNEAAAREAVEWYANVFKDRYYLEVQAHDSEGQAALNGHIFRLAKEFGLPVVATNDAHFLTRNDHAAHDVLLCVGLSKTRGDRDRMRYDEGLYFKSADEMAERFQEHPEALANTLKIADECHLAFEKRYYVPNFPLPTAQRETLDATIAARGGVAAVLPEKTRADAALSDDDKAQRARENELLRELAQAGCERRYGTPLPDAIQQRLDYELGVITTAGYAGYHLIVADFIQAARDRDIPVGPGRGSAAGSVVCYGLGITDIDPLQFDLLFERFLNPDRVSMPDIDVDFDPEGRERVIDYVREKYGHDAVCQIVTYGTLKARAAVKDVGRVLGFTPQETDQLAKLIPNAPNNSKTVQEAIEEIPDVQRLYQTDPRYKELLDYAAQLEGLRRHAGIHAAGVVIAPGPVDEYVPVKMEWEKGQAKHEQGSVVAQYDMTCLEHAGMLKMDFLGLATLTVIKDAIAAAEARHSGLHIDFHQIPLDDARTYELIRTGHTAGVFQLESDLATDKLVAMRASTFDDLVAANALLRPGPLDSGMTDKYILRKRGEEAVDYPHPLLADTLKDTQGIIVYQEQVMRAAQVLGDYTLAEADVLRKAVGKKDAELIKKELGRFVEKAVASGKCTTLEAERIAALVETFGRYGFNKSHSAAYALLAYQTAYLKAHYPAEFLAALLSSVMDNTEDVVRYLSECRALKVPVLPPSAQESVAKFNVVETPHGAAIRFALTAIKGVGSSLVEAIVDARSSGRFADFFDFVKRVAASGRLNRGALEALITAGACDGFGANRNQMLAVADQALKEAQRTAREAALGKISLFGGGDLEADATVTLTLPKLPELEDQDRLAREKGVIGVYVSGHPLDRMAELAETLASHRAMQLRAYVPGDLKIAGVVTQLKVAASKKSGKLYARAVIEDLTGGVEIIVFGDQWARYNFLLKEGELVVVEGNFNPEDMDSDKAPTLRVERVQKLTDALAAGDVALKIRLDRAQTENLSSMEKVRRLLEQHQGNAPVVLEVVEGEQVKVKNARSRVRPSPDLVQALREMLGDERVAIGKGDEAPVSASSATGSRSTSNRAGARR